MFKTTPRGALGKGIESLLGSAAEIGLNTRDPENKRRILDLIFQLAEKQNQTLVVVTHDMGILSGFDRVVDFEKMRFSKADEKSSGSVDSAVGGQA